MRQPRKLLYVIRRTESSNLSPSARDRCAGSLGKATPRGREPSRLDRDWRSPLAAPRAVLVEDLGCLGLAAWQQVSVAVDRWNG
jgi:hypothetical protein